MSATIDQLVNREYQYGFSTDIEAETLPPGLSEETVRFISAKKQEPEWLLEWRLKAYRRWLTMKEPQWANVRHPQQIVLDKYDNELNPASVAERHIFLLNSLVSGWKL